MTILNNNFKDKVTGKSFTVIKETSNFVLAINEDADPLVDFDNNYYLIYKPLQKVETTTNSYPAAIWYLESAEISLAEKELRDQQEVTSNLVSH